MSGEVKTPGFIQPRGAKSNLSMMAPDRTPTNPIPSTPEGTKMLRGISNCPIPRLSQNLDGIIKFHLDKRNAEKVEEACALLPAIMTADLVCDKSLKARVVVRFETDDELQAMTQQMAAIALEAATLQERLQNMAKEYNQIEDDRFAKAAVRYGLNLKERSYRVNDTDETIELVEADCETCQAKLSLQKGIEELRKEFVTNGPT
jgi:hypothetical protein